MEEKDLLYKYSIYVWQIQAVLYLKAELSCSFPLYKGAHELNYLIYIMKGAGGWGCFSWYTMQILC